MSNAGLWNMVEEATRLDGDTLRFFVKPSHNGYLYLINQEIGSDNNAIFSDQIKTEIKNGHCDKFGKE
jgi:hypothetical protein